MTKADHPAQLLDSPEGVTSLHVSANWDVPWQRFIPSLCALQELHLGKGVDVDPQMVSVWPPGLRSLSLSDVDLEEVLPKWATAVPELESLELRFEGDEILRLPDALAAFPHLTRLQVKAANVVLPAALAGGTVKELVLMLAPGDVPEGLCQMTQLEGLRLAQRICALPDAFAQLTALHTLDLSASLNEGTRSTNERSVSKLRPMPAVIARLPALRTLNLRRCGILERDLRVLGGHPHLRRLHLGFAGVTDLSPLRELPALRELDLEGCDRLRDLSPLAGSPLTWLGLDGCRGLRDLSPLLDLPELQGLSLKRCDEVTLGPVMIHPALREFDGDEEMLAQWARRGELAGLSPEGIRAGLASDDPAARIEALGQLATWVELTSTTETNAIFDLLELGSDARHAEEPIAVPLLSGALSTPGVEASLAARVFAACFRSVEDNLAPAREALEIVRQRGRDADEIAVVDAFLFARRFYDAGHRTWEDDVHETMIEEILPSFGAPALTHLLTRLDDDDLNGDELASLFVPAYRQASEKELDALDERLRSFVEEYREYLGADHFKELLGEIFKAQPAARERLADLLPDDLALRWSSRLKGVKTPEEARTEIEAFVTAVDSGELTLEALAKEDPGVGRAIRIAQDLPSGVARRLFEIARRVNQEQWLLPPVLAPLVRDEFDWLTTLDAAGRKMVEKWLGFWQREDLEPEGIDLTAARARLAGVPEEKIWQQAMTQAIDHGLNNAADLGKALARFAERPFPFEFTRWRSRALAQCLDALRMRDKADECVQLMDTLLALRPHLKWAPEDQQYPLTYLLPIALKRGPQFFTEHVAPWLEGVEVVEPRFAYNLACYQATHGDSDVLCAAIARAIELGKPKDQFLEDPDFAGRLEEPAVKALLGTTGRRRRYYAMSRVSYYDSPCRFLDMGYEPDRPSWWKHDWHGGQPLDPLPEGPLRFNLEPYRKEHAEMSRALPLLALRKIPLMHRSLVEVLEAHGAKLQKIPARLVDPDDGTEYGNFFAVNVLGVLPPQALGRFHGSLSDPASTDEVGFDQSATFEEPLDGLVLAWIEDTYTLVVFESLRDALIEAGFNELQFNELSDIAL